MRKNEKVRPLEESLAAINRHLADGAGAHEPEPRCPTCRDTGWQELYDGRVQHCVRGCEIPRKKGPHQEAAERLHRVFEGPEAFS